MNTSHTTRNALDCGDSSPLFPGATQSSDKSEHSKTWRKAMLPLFCFFLLHSAFCLRAVGQSYSIDWSTIEGGGGTSTGGTYQVIGTIGQPDAGTMSGGNFTLEGGFWGIIAAVQTPGAPLLSIECTSPSSVIISWPASTENWQLQENSNLETTNWSTVATTPQEVNGRKQIIVSPPTGNRFYRLQK